MSFNPFFLALLGILAVASVLTWRWVQKALRPRQRSGPVPGYAITHGGEVDFDAPNLGDEVWCLTRVEEYHMANRTRAVVTVEVERSEGLGAFARSFALEFQATHTADVVFVDCHVPDSGERTRYLFAPDGRGWAGEPVSHVMTSS